VKLKFKRVNPLTLDPGEKVIMGAIQLTKGKTINMFPVKVYLVAEDGVEIQVEIENDFNMESEQSGDV
jgi:hypothetical protein